MRENLRHFGTKVFGIRWTRCAISNISTSYGASARLIGRSGNDAGFLARAPGFSHRAHRLQGIVAVAMVDRARRRSEWLCSLPAHRSQLIRARPSEKAPYASHDR